MLSPLWLIRCRASAHMYQHAMRISTSVDIVVLGELERRNTERKNNYGQPIGHTESRMQSHLAYVGKLVANIYTTST